MDTRPEHCSASKALWCALTFKGVLGYKIVLAISRRALDGCDFGKSLRNHAQTDYRGMAIWRLLKPTEWLVHTYENPVE